jgi:hypothetical protein
MRMWGVIKTAHFVKMSLNSIKSSWGVLCQAKSTWVSGAFEGGVKDLIFSRVMAGVFFFLVEVEAFYHFYCASHLKSRRALVYVCVEGICVQPSTHHQQPLKRMLTVQWGVFYALSLEAKRERERSEFFYLTSATPPSSSPAVAALWMEEPLSEIRITTTYTNRAKYFVRHISHR